VLCLINRPVPPTYFSGQLKISIFVKTTPMSHASISCKPSFQMTNSTKVISFFLILFAQLLFSSTSAQQRLLAIKKYDYNLPNIGDSSVYIYTNTTGILTSNEPIFEFDGTFVNWFYNKPIIKCDIEYKYSQLSPSVPFDTLNYQLTGGLVTSNQSTLNPTKNLYAYNTNNSLVSSEKQVLYSFSPNWLTESREEYEYNANNLKSATRRYFSDQNLLISIDSMFYNSQNQLIKYKSINYVSTTGQPNTITQSIISYNGNEISNVKNYFGNGFSFFNLLLVWDIDYTYSAGKVSQLEGLNLTFGNIVVVNYTYDVANQKIRNIVSYKDGQLDRQIDYDYDNNGFIVKEKIQTSSSPGVLYITNENNFYYEQYTSTASLDETEKTVLRVFPNPTNNFITITTDENSIGSEFTIYNSLGQNVRNGSITSASTVCDLENVSNGIYFLHLNNEIYKIVKQ
jgi:hypothetical protein